MDALIFDAANTGIGSLLAYFMARASLVLERMERKVDILIGSKGDKDDGRMGKYSCERETVSKGKMAGKRRQKRTVKE